METSNSNQENIDPQTLKQENVERKTDIQKLEDAIKELEDEVKEVKGIKEVYNPKWTFPTIQQSKEYHKRYKRNFEVYKDQNVRTTLILLDDKGQLLIKLPVDERDNASTGLWRQVEVLPWNDERVVRDEGYTESEVEQVEQKVEQQVEEVEEKCTLID